QQVVTARHYGVLMRTPGDRIRHALSFELIALLIVTPLGALAFDKPLQDIGVISIVGATIATAWNYIYNYIFDTMMQRYKGTTLKTVWLRVLHALLFEGGLLI